MKGEELRVALLQPEELADRGDLDLVDEVALVRRRVDLEVARDEDAEDHSAAAAAESGAEEGAMALITSCWTRTQIRRRTGLQLITLG